MAAWSGRSAVVLLVSGVLAAAFLGGCDTVPGVRDLGDTAPRVGSLDFTPRVIDISQLDPGELADGEVEFDINISVQVDTEGEDDVDSVTFVIRPPLRSSVPIATGTLVASGGGVFQGVRTLTLATGQPGNYTVAVYASDRIGQLSNQVQGNLLLDASNAPGTPPVVELVEAFPEEITPPGTLVIVATVSDADGLLNVLRVAITTPNGQTFNMSDDGESLGDATAGDGKWTAAFTVPAGLPAGVQVFEVQAFDRNGNQSVVVEKPVTIR